MPRTRAGRNRGLARKGAQRCLDRAMPDAPQPAQNALVQIVVTGRTDRKYCILWEVLGRMGCVLYTMVMAPHVRRLPPWRMEMNVAQILVHTLNDPGESRTYDLHHEIVRAVGFALAVSGQPHARPTCVALSLAIAPAFAMDDLVLVGTLHMLSQIDVYTDALRREGLVED